MGVEKFRRKGRLRRGFRSWSYRGKNGRKIRIIDLRV